MNDWSNCRYCSEISKIQEEDPIGTAGTADKWLIVEVPRPWQKNIWDNKPAFKPLIGILIELEKLQPNPSLRLMAIAPDKEYSQPDFIRVFYYSRPGEMFSQYEKKEYIVPSSQLINLTRAILLQPEQLPQFSNYLQQTNQIREILVCTHTQYDTACGRYGTPLYQKLRKNYAEESAGTLRVWNTSHFGGHKFAPTLIDFPSGKFWGHLQPEILDTLIYQKGDLETLQPYYRGWSGLQQYEQIAERAVWMQSGWEWQHYPKSGHIIDRDRGNIGKVIFKQLLKIIPLKKAKLLLGLLDGDSDWVEVVIEYVSLDNIQQAYQVRVELKGKVITASKSAKPMELISIKQYQVTNIIKNSSGIC